MAFDNLTADDFGQLARALRPHVEKASTDELLDGALALTNVFERAGCREFQTDRFLIDSGVMPDATTF